MSGTSVLFDAPGPKAKRNSRIASVLSLIVILDRKSTRLNSSH